MGRVGLQEPRARTSDILRLFLPKQFTAQVLSLKTALTVFGRSFDIVLLLSLLAALSNLVSFFCPPGDSEDPTSIIF